MTFCSAACLARAPTQGAPRCAAWPPSSFASLPPVSAPAQVVHARSRAPPIHDFAMKILDKRFMVKEGKTASVLMERSIMARALHPNIVRLVYSFQDADSLYFVMDLCRGGELAAVISHFKSGLPPDLTRFYAVQVLQALEYLHTTLQVVHRDLKPDNILLTSTGRVKLADFGSALDETAPTSTAAFVGTAEFVPPELLRDEVVHATGDLWALGVTLYACATGVTPFRGASEYLTFQVVLNFNDAATRATWGVDLDSNACTSTADRPELPFGLGLQEETGVLRFPSSCPYLLRDLILRLIVVDPMKRLGVARSGSGSPCGPLNLNYSDLKGHPFLSSVDWTRTADLNCPYTPPLRELPEPVPLGVGLFDAELVELGLAKAAKPPVAPVSSSPQSESDHVVAAARSASDSNLSASKSPAELPPVSVRSSSSTAAGVGSGSSLSSSLSALWSTLSTSTGSGATPAGPPSGSSWLPTGFSEWRNARSGSTSTPLAGSTSSGATVMTSTSTSVTSSRPGSSSGGRSETGAQATVTPLTLPRSPPVSPLPDTRLLLSADAPSNASSAAPNASSSLSTLVIEQYIAAAPLVARPAPSPVPPIDAPPPQQWWTTSLDARERVVLQGKVRKRRNVGGAAGRMMAMPVIHFTPAERELALTQGHPSGPRLLYMNPAAASRSVRVHLLREEDVRVQLLPEGHDASPEACDFDLVCAGVTHALCDAQGAARWATAVNDAKGGAAHVSAAAIAGAAPMPHA